MKDSKLSSLELDNFSKDRDEFSLNINPADDGFSAKNFSSFSQKSYINPSFLLNSIDAWEEDKKLRFDEEEFTKSFHKSVPILKYIDWKILEIEQGYAKTIVPLNNASTNQHIAHQAAIIELSSDFTGGIALSTLFQKVPVIGIHKMKTDYGIYIWTAKSSTRWLYPSCNDLVCVASICKSRFDNIKNRFVNGKQIVLTVKSELFNEDLLIAESYFTYWVQDSYSIRKNAFDKSKIKTLYDFKFKSSARLIAGLRAKEMYKPKKDRLFTDDYSIKIAGKHGMIIAERFLEHTPQLQNMIASRTKHLDDFLASVEYPFIIVNIGSGLDSRAWRLKTKAKKIIELDLPSMISEKNRIFKEFAKPNCQLIQLPIDLREHDIYLALTEELENNNLPIIFIWEGGSMYFDKKISKKLLTSISKIMTNPQSRLWFDFVDDSVINNTHCIDEVKLFNDNIQKMGEPFLTGYSDISNDMLKYNLETLSVDFSDKYIKSKDKIYGLYRFSILKRNY